MKINQEIIPELSIRNKVSSLLDLIAQKIIDIGDFFVFKHIGWTEAILFLYSSFRAVWFIAFGVENANYSYYFNDHIWTTIFVIMATTHLVGFFMRSMCLRITASYICAIVWFALVCLALYSRTSAPAVPSLLPLTLLSIVVVVRLSHEHKLENE